MTKNVGLVRAGYLWLGSNCNINWEGVPVVSILHLNSVEFPVKHYNKKMRQVVTIKLKGRTSIGKSLCSIKVLWYRRKSNRITVLKISKETLLLYITLQGKMSRSKREINKLKIWKILKQQGFQATLGVQLIWKIGELWWKTEMRTQSNYWKLSKTIKKGSGRSEETQTLQYSANKCHQKILTKLRGELIHKWPKTVHQHNLD